MRMDAKMAGPQGPAKASVSQNNAQGGQGEESTGPKRAGFMPPGLAKTNGVPPGLVGRETLPPGIQKKMQPPVAQQEEAPPREVNEVFTPAEAAEPQLLPLTQQSGLQRTPVQQQTLTPVPTLGVLSQPQPSFGTFQSFASPLNQGPPSILSGVPEAFSSGNPLAGPLQLVNNINANAFSTLQSTGLLQGL